MSELSQKLLNLVAAMEHNELVNNPGNWNLLVAAAEKLNEQPNQDELWEEFFRGCLDKKRYRITRVK